MPERILVPDAPERVRQWAALGGVEDREPILHALMGHGQGIERAVDDGWPPWLPDTITTLYAPSPYMSVAEYRETEAAISELALVLARPVDYEAARWRYMIATLASMPDYDPDGVVRAIDSLHDQAFGGRQIALEQWAAARDDARLNAHTFNERALAAIAAAAAEAAALNTIWPLHRDSATARVLHVEADVRKLGGEAGGATAGVEREVREAQRRRLLAALHDSGGETEEARRLLTDDEESELRERWAALERGERLTPVAKIFTPDAAASWWIAAIDPREPDIMYGIADLGIGFAEWGRISRAELEAVRGPFGLAVERDHDWRPGDAYPAIDDGGDPR